MKKTFKTQCKICKKIFISKNSNKIFCSNSCKTKSFRINNLKEYNKKCKNCGIDFISNYKKTKFCSNSCSAIDKNKGTKEVKCRNCNSIFLQKHGRHFFCTGKCKQEYNNKKVPMMLVPCSNCEKEIERIKYVAKKNKNFFCSRNCESEFRKRESEDFRNCDFCKNVFSCNKSEKLKFCSTLCQNEWQKISSSGKNHPSYNHNITDEMRSKKCECCGKNMIGTPCEFITKKYCSYSCKVKMMPKSLSFPHSEVLRMMSELNIEGEIEFQIGRYSADCYLLNTKLVIEVMGTFWHCDNRKYIKAISKIQEKSIIRDRKKRKTIQENGFTVLYIWEEDTHNDYDCCKKLIMEFVNRNGNIDNKHSMNYTVENGKLKLRSKILVPFFEK